MITGSKNNAAGVGNATIASLKWVTVLQLSEQLIAMAVTLTVVEWISEAQLGLAVFVLAFVEVIVAAIDLGFNGALIQKKELNDDDVVTAFWVNLGVALFFAALLYFGAEFIATDFLNDPSAASMLHVFSVVLPLRALGSLQAGLNARNLSFRPVVLCTLPAIVMGTAAKLSLAVAGAGASSLVYGEMCALSVSSLLFWFTGSWRPRHFRIHLASLVGLVTFGSSLMVNDLIQFICTKIDVLAIGRLLSKKELGIYVIATTIVTILPNQVNTIVQKVLFPSFSRTQNLESSIQDMFFTGTRYISLLSFPIIFAIMVVCDDILAVTLGEHAAGTLPIIRIVCLTALTNSAGGIMNMQIFKALGKLRLVLAISVTRLVATTGFIAFGSQWGIMGVAWSLFAYGVIFRMVNQYIVDRVIHAPLPRYLANVWPAVRAGLLMAAAMLAWKLGMRRFGWTPAVSLVTTLIVGISAYVLILFRLNRHEFDQVVAAFRKPKTDAPCPG